MYREKWEKGSAMVFTLFALTLLAIASTTTHLSVVNAVRSSETRLHALQAMYAAESGLDATIYLLNQDSSLVPECEYPDDTPSLSSLDEDFPEASLLPGNGLAFRTWFDGSVLVAEGTSGGISQRISIEIDEDTTGVSFDNAVACQGSITVEDDAIVTGDLRSELVEDWNDGGGEFITGPDDAHLGEDAVITVGNGGDPSTAVGGFNTVDKQTDNDQIDYPTPPPPSPSKTMSLSGNQSETINESCEITKINGTVAVVFDTSDYPLTVLVTDKNFAGNIDIRVTGPHPLYLYVDGSFKITGNSGVNESSGNGKGKGKGGASNPDLPEDTGPLVLIGTGPVGSTIDIQGSASTGGTFVYAPNYDVTIKGKDEKSGAIIAGRATFKEGPFHYDEDLADLDMSSVGGGEVVYSVLQGTWKKI